MTIAPELPEASETIARATELGIRASIGHSNATKAEAWAGLDAGAITATHTFNAMRPLDHREPGILGVVLDRDDIFADLICDGLHVSPEAVRLWFKAKEPRMGILITDALEATGMPMVSTSLARPPYMCVGAPARLTPASWQAVSSCWTKPSQTCGNSPGQTWELRCEWHQRILLECWGCRTRPPWDSPPTSTPSTGRERVPAQSYAARF
jgi:hypothetical protein